MTIRGTDNNGVICDEEMLLVAFLEIIAKYGVLIREWGGLYYAILLSEKKYLYFIQ